MAKATVSKEQIHNAVQNEHDNVFELGDREFRYLDLDYDSYMEFVELSRPVLQLVLDSLKIEDANGLMDLKFDPTSFDWTKVIEIAGKDIPKMAHIVCRQSDPAITVAEVKRLARRPMPMLEIIVGQIKHNELIKEFADFFQRMAGQMKSFAPSLGEALTPKSLTQPTA